ncbi:MAG: hypothetical protein OXF77_05350 [Thaumarchaeota archaeon]|nr:hypothetical protein [Nitrososphaerota archaeon]
MSKDSNNSKTDIEKYINFCKNNISDTDPIHDMTTSKLMELVDMEVASDFIENKLSEIIRSVQRHKINTLNELLELDADDLAKVLVNLPDNIQTKLLDNFNSTLTSRVREYEAQQLANADDIADVSELETYFEVAENMKTYIPILTKFKSDDLKTLLLACYFAYSGRGDRASSIRFARAEVKHLTSLKSQIFTDENKLETSLSLKQSDVDSVLKHHNSSDGNKNDRIKLLNYFSDLEPSEKVVLVALGLCLNDCNDDYSTTQPLETKYSDMLGIGWITDSRDRGFDELDTILFDEYEPQKLASESSA